MKIKKASIFSLILALALVAIVTTGFATSAISADNGKEVPINELDLTTGDVGDEIDGAKIVVDSKQGQYRDTAELNLTRGTMGDEIGGARMIEGNSHIEDLSNLKYVEGDVGTEAYGIRIIEVPEQ